MVKTIIKTEGMVCGMCESHMNDAIRRNFRIKKVSSNAGKGETEVISQESLDGERLKMAIEPTGYKLLSVEEVPYEKKGLFSFFMK